MNNPTETFASALDREIGAFVVVYYPNSDEREVLLAEVDSLMPGTAPRLLTNDIDAALAAPDALVLLTPDDEAEAVLTLDGMRERFAFPPRSQPVVLFLLRGGQGSKQLPYAAGFASWIRGREVDPYLLATVDVAAERERFVREAGQTPETWLQMWDAGSVSTKPESLARAYLARLLCEAP